LAPGLEPTQHSLHPQQMGSRAGALHSSDSDTGVGGGRRAPPLCALTKGQLVRLPQPAHIHVSPEGRS
jgi:hypothetical protein